MNEAKKKTRRRYDAELKQQILIQCDEPGASVASIALSHGINANVVSGQPCHLDGDVGSLQQPLISSTASPPS
ncbi:MAG: transposase [Rhodoferax sp.]|nr:transposase [Rhodoferax sp.]